MEGEGKGSRGVCPLLDIDYTYCLPSGRSV